MSTFEAATSLIVLTVLYAVLAVVELKLLATYIGKGADPFEEPPRVSVGGSDDDDARSPSPTDVRRSSWN